MTPIQHLTPEELEEILIASSSSSGLDIGMVSNYDDTEETRFILTPEACGILTARGHSFSMQAGAGIDLNFSDEDYARHGVKITDRKTALQAPIVLSYRPLRADDVKQMKKGATLLCMLDNSLFETKVVEVYMDQEITLGCLNNMVSHNDEPIFSNIVDEIDGRAAIMYAEDNLSFLGGGKGVLLAGVAGINPCEVLIIGTGTKVNYAAIAAMDAGAAVTMMDNDVSALQLARNFCGDRLTVCSIHPNVLINRIKSADVIIIDNCTRDFEIPHALYAAMKPNVYMLDLVDTEPSQSVPRTVTMGLSNVMVNFFEEMSLKDGIEGMIETTPGVQCGLVTYRGKLVDKLIAGYLGLSAVDIRLLLAGGN